MFRDFEFKELRISITNKCNLNCLYCRNEGIPKSVYEMNKDEIIELINQSVKFGAKKIKFTGGEPLLRNDLIEIIKCIPDNIVVSITTNGIFLDKFLDKLYDVGVDEIVLSLDSLKQLPYNIKIHEEKVRNVLNKISKEYSFRDVRLDMVLLPYNIDQIGDFIKYTSSYGIHLRILELAILNYNELKNLHVDLRIAEKEIEKYGYEGEFISSRLLKRYKTENNTYILLTYSLCDHKACGCCFYGRGHVRVTVDGKLLPCLMDNVTIDILNKIRKKESIEKELKQCIEIMKRKSEIEDLNLSLFFDSFYPSKNY